MDEAPAMYRPSASSYRSRLLVSSLNSTLGVVPPPQGLCYVRPERLLVPTA